MKIHYHSDCIFFAGCENMIANFLNSKKINENFKISFSYRYSNEYHIGLSKRVFSNISLFPLFLFDIYSAKIAFLNLKLPNQFSSIIVHILKPLFYFINIIILFFLFKKLKADILHINNGGFPGAISCSSAAIAGKLAGIKKIIYVINNIPQNYKSPQRIIDFPFDFITKSCVNYFITGSKYTSDQVKKTLKTNKTIVIHNGIFKREITETPKEYRKKLGVLDTKFIISIIAVLEKRKGHIYLLKSIKLLSETNPDILTNLVFIIEGNGEEFNNLFSFAEENKLNQYIIFIKNEEKVFNLINSSDLIILPSISNEDFPNIIIESMSVGKPVISTNISGIPEQIVQMETGIVIEPKNHIEIANSIKLLYTDATLRNNLAEKAKKRFENLFDSNIAIDNYFNLYKKL
ncbi:glycosyltransferase family 4 protein [Silvanigrella sp.]|uniref:glycosyltransferase family 4 protein n=1 Tax=Silvanigrella sp. TaxID=2024976 RepID=UPI0037CB930B